MLKVLGKIFIVIICIILILLLAAYFKFFHDIELLWPPSQIGCSEDYQCKYSEFHNSCGNTEYQNFKGHEVYVFDNPSCQCTFYICSQK